jgi:hypothetical protein
MKHHGPPYIAGLTAEPDLYAAYVAAWRALSTNCQGCNSLELSSQYRLKLQQRQSLRAPVAKQQPRR